jgi:saccharopine dehydrogenase (NAD+, L-lysine-forming)
MARVLVIGSGNVGGAGLHKMLQFPEIFSEICVVSRNFRKTQKVLESAVEKYGAKVPIGIYSEDISKLDALKKIMERKRFDLVIHWGHPYDNLTIMKACLECGVNYIDTACYEHPDRYGFSYKQQLAMNAKFLRHHLLAILGLGFDPGQTSIYCTYLISAGILDEIFSIDILDCNGGTKDAIWAPNFDPEINIRELVLPVKFWGDGAWQECGSLIDKKPIRFAYNFPETGKHLAHLMYHEELETLVRHFPKLKRARFWMTFTDEYLTYLRVIHNLRLDGIRPVLYEGHEVIPVRFLKSLLPKGEDFNSSYRGNTCIECVVAGEKDGQKKVVEIYNVKKHEDAFAETDRNAIGYTTAIPGVLGAMLFLKGKWKGIIGVKTPEEMDPIPFMDNIGFMGLPWTIRIRKVLPPQLDKDY